MYAIPGITTNCSTWSAFLFSFLVFSFQDTLYYTPGWFTSEQNEKKTLTNLRICFLVMLLCKPLSFRVVRISASCADHHFQLFIGPIQLADGRQYGFSIAEFVGCARVLPVLDARGNKRKRNANPSPQRQWSEAVYICDCGPVALSFSVGSRSSLKQKIVIRSLLMETASVFFKTGTSFRKETRKKEKQNYRVFCLS